MSKPTEQFTELHKKSIDAATRLAQISLDNSKRIMELQVEIARSLFEESVKNAKALTEAKDPQAALALRTQFAQETTQKMIEAARRIGEISAEAQAEFNSMLGQQLAGSSQEMMEAFQKMMGVSGFPGGNQNAMASMQQAFDTAKNAFDQIAKASSAAFAGMGGLAGQDKDKGKGKSIKVE
ncbi:MAG: phasin protein [Rhodocyclaceae bacterium]|jgi:phasin family protein|nr:phasin protein [Rhodocyclaceae bacterium]